MIYRANFRAQSALLVAGIVALSLTGCAFETHQGSSGSTPPGASQSPENTPSPAATAPGESAVEQSSTNAWPEGWPTEIPHPTSGTPIYSHTERGALYKIGLNSTPEAFSALVSAFSEAGYTDEVEGGNDGEQEVVHNFSNGEWRVIVKGFQTNAGFEMHYIAKIV